MVCNMHFKYLKMHFIKQAGKTGYPHTKEWIWILTLKLKSGSEDPNIRATTMHLRRKQEKKLYDSWICNDFLDMTLKA